MSMIRCVRRLAVAGRLSEQDRDRLEHVYATTYADAQAAGAAAGEAERAANEQFDRTLTRIYQQSRRVAQLQREAEKRLLEDVAQSPTGANRKGMRDIGEYGQRIINRVFFESHALFRLDMGELSALAHEFRRTAVSGKRMNPTTAVRMLREIFGEDTGDASAKTLAEAWKPLSRRKIQQFNDAGGDVAVREDWHVPQRHDAITIGTRGFEAWKKAIYDTVDFARTINADTGLPFKPHEFEAVLPQAFEDIKWRGFGGEAETGGGRGMALWRRRNDPRFFVFKDADAWLRYHAEYGGGAHIFEVMADYLRSINHDIAAMQRFGPNPNRTVEWLAGGDNAPGNSLIMHHARLADSGKASFFPSADDIGKKFKDWRGREQYAVNKASATLSAWRQFTGEARRPENKGWAFVEGTVNNAIYASKLPFTVFLSGGDVMNQAATRAFNGVSMRGMMRDLGEALKAAPNRKVLAELGAEIDAGLSTLHSEARDAAAIHGWAPMRYLTDRVMTWTALKPVTMGLRAMWTLGVLHEVTRWSNTEFARLPKDFRAALLRHGIDEGAWEFVRATPRFKGNGPEVIRPIDIAKTDIFSLRAHPNGAIGESVIARPGLTRGQEVAQRLLTLIQEEGEAATISGTPRSARFLQGYAKPGTLRGTILGSFAKLKTYAVSHFQHHAFRAAEINWREGGGIRGKMAAGRYYGLQMLVPSMLLVGAGTSIQDVLQGKNAPDMTDWRFWDRVFWRTVSLGFFQDLFQGVFDPETRAQGASHFAGPTVEAYTDIATLIGDAIGEAGAAAGVMPDKFNTGRQAIRAARDFVPRTFATDLAVDRLGWDNLQRMVDPEADADFSRRAQRAPQGWWWAPGEGAPQSAPDLSTLDLADENQSLGPPQQ